MTDNAGEEWLTVEECAAELRVHPQTVYRWCKQGELRHTRVNRIYRVPRSALSQAPAEARPLTAGPPLSVQPAPRVIALANQKGGVGKTTTAINLGAALADLGQRVLIIDLDPQANASFALTGEVDLTPSLADLLEERLAVADVVRPTCHPGVMLIPSNTTLHEVTLRLPALDGSDFLLKEITDQVADAFDVVLLDCAPRLGELTRPALVAASEVLVPVRPHIFSLMGLEQLFATIERVERRVRQRPLPIVGLLVNQGALRSDGTARLQTYQDVLATIMAGPYGQHLFATTIPDAAAIERAHQSGLTVGQWQPRSKIATAYRRLAQEVIDRG